MKSPKRKPPLYALNSGITEVAKHTLTGDPEFDSNPLITALTPLPTLPNGEIDVAQLFEELSFVPQVSQDAVARMTVPVRMAKAMQLLDVHVPLDREIDLAIDLYSLMCTGYVVRNPGAERLASRDERLCEVREYRRRQAARTALCMAVIGISGSGKTSAIGMSLRRQPQIISFAAEKNEFLPEKVVAWMASECPRNRSRRAFGLAILAQGDHLVGGGWYELYRDANEDDILMGIAAFVEEHHVGLLVIDEIQFAINRRDPADTDLLDYLVHLSNVVHVPILLVGTPQVMRYIDPQIRAARRFVGSAIWDRFPSRTVSTNGEPSTIIDENIRRVLQCVWPCQYTLEQASLDDTELIEALVDSSQNVLALLMVVISLAQRREIALGRSAISAGTVKSVYAEQMQMVHPVVEALKSGSEESIEPFDDLLHRDNLWKVMERHSKREEEEAVARMRKTLDRFAKRLTAGSKQRLASKAARYSLPKPENGAAATKTPSNPEDAVKALSDAGLLKEPGHH